MEKFTVEDYFDKVEDGVECTEDYPNPYAEYHPLEVEDLGLIHYISCSNCGMVGILEKEKEAELTK